MKIQRDKLRQYQKKITVITSREKDIARECLARGEKGKALLALRRKKYQESLLAKTDSQLEQLEKLTSSVEFALVQRDVVFGLQQGTNVLQQIHKEMGGLEAVEKLMGETEDARAYQRVSYLACRSLHLAVYQIHDFIWAHNIAMCSRFADKCYHEQEISEALAGQMSNEDEDEVEDELEAMEQEIEGVKMPDAPTNTVVGEGVLPDVPSTLAEEEARQQRQKERAKARRVALEA
jgi:charged multivesicular body protein 6